MSTQDNTNVVRTLFDTLNKRDFDTILKSVDKNCQVTVVPRDQNFKGTDGFRQFLQNRQNVSSDLKYEVKNTIGCEDTVTVEYTAKGKQSGPFPVPSGGEIQPTGKTFTLKFCDVVTLNNGKITRWNSYYDITSILNQLGVLHELTHH